VADEERAADAAIDLLPGVFWLPLAAKPLCRRRPAEEQWSMKLRAQL
jgi:hypothetical protein